MTATAVLLGLRDVDNNLYARKGRRKGLPHGATAHMGGDLLQLLLGFALRDRRFHLVEQPYLRQFGFAELLAAAPEKLLLEPGELLAQNLYVLEQLSFIVSQLRVLTHQRFDVPLHARRVS